MTVVDRDVAAIGLPERVVHVLRGGGVGLVVATRSDGLPEVLHWGRDTGPVSTSDAHDLVLAQDRAVSPSAYDAAWPLTLLPTEHDGWEGRPGIAGQVGGRPLVPVWREVAVTGTEDDLVVEAAYADEGPTLKRWKPRARGRVNRIKKRTCHVTLVLAEVEQQSTRRRPRRQSEAAESQQTTAGGASEPKAAKRRTPRRKKEAVA